MKQKMGIGFKTKVQISIVGVFLLVLILFSVAQKKNLGQGYQQIYFNGNLIGNISNRTDADRVLNKVRRKIAQESNTPVCMDFEYTSDKANQLFETLLTEDEFSGILEEQLRGSELGTQVRAYTVAIDGYRGNFNSMTEVKSFLNEVKDRLEEGKQYAAELSKEKSHISGIFQAKLQNVTGQEAEESVQKSNSGKTTSGVNAAMLSAMEDADAAGGSDTYETGVLDMQFVEKVEIYEKYVGQGDISDVTEQVEEVTKEKETNKIYVVENGDVLSVIAMNHDTTVANIMALNGFDSVEARIYPGQELVIAVPQPDLSMRIVQGEVYEEDYNADPVIIENNEWYTTKEVVRQEGTTGHRERNDIVTYENGVEVSRELAHETILTESTPAVIERGTITPPTYIKPIAGGHFTSGFGRRWGRMHKGVDWGCPVGTTVYASSAGTVVSAGYNGGYGNNVVISHPDGRLTRYAHNSKLLVHAGQWVEQGQSIALSGSTGRSTGPHVHFEIYINGAAVNPLNYIGK